MRTASIDIGTNSVLMLIADVTDGDIKVIRQYYDIARLGEGLSESGIINENAILRLSDILEFYYNECRQYKTEKIIAVGTSALRDAANNAEVIERIFNKTKIKINVISGLQEAKLSFSGAINSPEKSVLIDIGGGSTEIITGKGQEIDYSISLDMGAVRFTENYFSNQPPTLLEIQKAGDRIIDILENSVDTHKLKNVSAFYGVAGTATTIAATILNTTDDNIKAYDNFIINYDDLKSVFLKYISSTSDEIISKYKVHPKRADLISMGSLILICIFEYLKIEKLIVNSRGLRFGILKNIELF